MRGRTDFDILHRIDMTPTDRSDPSSVRLRLPPSPARGEGFASYVRNTAVISLPSRWMVMRQTRPPAAMAASRSVIERISPPLI